jgi:hypothetical protein
LNALFLLTLYLIYFRANQRSQLLRSSRRLGPYRAAIDLTEALMEDLGLNLCAYDNRQLASVIRKRKLKGMYYTESPMIGGERSPHVGLSSIEGHEKIKVIPGQLYG